jgi:murein DD-endopeptidase MepM/ murein hydrolase activator NlpD
MAIEDSYPPGQEDDNNYVWIAHANGEWTKYTHLETGSVTAEGHVVGDFVPAGTPLGLEGEVGADGRVHTHFEVVVPDDPANAITAGGFIIGQSRVPLIFGVAGNVPSDGQTYAAGPC